MCGDNAKNPPRGVFHVGILTVIRTACINEQLKLGATNCVRLRADMFSDIDRAAPRHSRKNNVSSHLPPLVEQRLERLHNVTREGNICSLSRVWSVVFYYTRIVQVRMYLRCSLFLCAGLLQALGQYTGKSCCYSYLQNMVG